MYKFFHKLFGWDYMSVPFGFEAYTVRVRVAPNGKRWVRLYGENYFEGSYKWNHSTPLTF